MTKLEKIIGQVVDYKESNDNAPPSFSAPKSPYKNVLKSHSKKIVPGAVALVILAHLKVSLLGVVLSVYPMIIGIVYLVNLWALALTTLQKNMFVKSVILLKKYIQNLGLAYLQSASLLWVNLNVSLHMMKP